MNAKSLSLWAIGNRGEAIQVLEPAIGRFPANYELAFNLGVMKWRACCGDDMEAVRLLRMCTSAGAAEACVEGAVGDVKMEAGDFLGAAQSFAKALGEVRRCDVRARRPCFARPHSSTGSS